MPVSQTFAAGIIPGLILLLFMIGLVLFKCRHIERSEPATNYDKFKLGIQAFPALLTPLIILGGIYGGFLTPSESAAVSGIWAMFMGFFIYRELKVSSLLESIKDTAVTTAVIFSIIAMATFLSKVFTYTRFPQFIISSITEMGVGLNFFWFAMALICLILGTFIEIVPVFYLTIPIFSAIILSFDQSLIHLYVVLSLIHI